MSISCSSRPENKHKILSDNLDSITLTSDTTIYKKDHYEFIIHNDKIVEFKIDSEIQPKIKCDIINVIFKIHSIHFVTSVIVILLFVTFVVFIIVDLICKCGLGNFISGTVFISLIFLIFSNLLLIIHNNLISTLL